MRRKAFTLVELLVVVSVIALLLALTFPTFSKARALGRATICRSNLHHIAVGFSADSAQRRSAGGAAAADFPNAQQFPSVPANVIASPAVFICPETEAEVEATDGSPSGEGLDGLVYACRNRGFEVAFNDPAHQGMGAMNLGTREGSDQFGPYIEIGLDDNSPVTASYMDNDGHDGIIRIYSNMGGMRVAKLMKYSCGESNCVTYYGKPLFTGPKDPAEVNSPGSEEYGWLGPGTTKNGMEVELGKGFGARSCTYGMTSGAEQFPPLSRKILVLDYDRTVVDPEDARIADMLQQAARHMGSLNVLFADNSVRSFGPTELDPLLPGNASWWKP